MAEAGDGAERKQRQPLELLHAPGWDPEPIRAALSAERIDCRIVDGLRNVPAPSQPTVLVVHPAARDRFHPGDLARLADAGVGIILIAGDGETDVPVSLGEPLLSAFLPPSPGPRQLLVAIKAGFRESVARQAAAAARLESADRSSEVTDLTEIGIRLLTERDYAALLALVLSQARRITHSDAGSLYLVLRPSDAAPTLRFKLTQNESRPDIPFAELSMPLDATSLAGHSALSGESLVLADAYALPDGAPYSFNRSFDERYGYRTKSMLVVPMPNHRGEVIGVLQLINRKNDPRRPFADPADVERRAMPYTEREVKLVTALAGQAAVSLENSQLYEEIERLFEGFVRAAVTAIEQRDPTTSGHSERVANLTVRLVEVVDATAAGPYRSVRFSREQQRELRYAALLHDVGKLAVREQVLVKAKKLYPDHLERLRDRCAFVRRTAEWERERARAAHLERHGADGYAELVARLDARYAERLAAVERLWDVVVACNEPTVLAEGDFGELRRLAASTYLDGSGAAAPLLSPDEVLALSITKGSLDEAEWEEMRSHVAHTFNFLNAIPWTKALRGVPAIAHAHHEKLDGSGYPRRLRAADIPIQSRMMTIADIFDALTAADRPYKRAVPTPAALDILADEARDGGLDAELLRLFVDSRVYQVTAGG